MKHTTQRKKASSEYSHICKASSFVPITFKHFRLAYCVETTNLHFLYPSLMHPHTYAHSSHSIDSDFSNACPYRLAASAGHIYILTPSLVIAHTLTHSHIYSHKRLHNHTHFPSPMMLALSAGLSNSRRRLLITSCLSSNRLAANCIARSKLKTERRT
jgi:hypothetical protein